MLSIKSGVTIQFHVSTVKGNVNTGILFLIQEEDNILQNDYRRGRSAIFNM